MYKPLISAVIPIYNTERYLERCIRSVVSQTYENLQIILVDDGSPDNSPQICDRWAEQDPRIRAIHKQNAGLGMARNSGMDAADGEYIFFFDSDDYVEHTIVEKCVASALEHGSDVVLFGYTDAYEGGRLEPQPVKTSELVFRHKSLTGKLLPAIFSYSMGLGLGACGKMFRRAVLEEQGLRFRSEREIISEDAFFVLEVFSHIATASVVPENLYYYYKNDHSLTTTYNSRRQQKNDIFLCESVAYARKAGLPEAVMTTICVRYHAYTISAMKQVLSSQLPKPEIKQKLYEIFRSPVLRSTLYLSVLRTEKTTQQLFFILLKLRCYSLCHWMLRLKNKS